MAMEDSTVSSVGAVRRPKAGRTSSKQARKQAAAERIGIGRPR